MSTIQEIEQAVSHLLRNDFANFREWFEDYDAQVWDEQFESDVTSGKLDTISNQAISDFRKGNFKEL
ncbi:MAG: hypothetical protein KGZ58_07815 [Ignavibacteriales bacterium]|nr:hypothetical protein [Ignavibacteriales bacterium]